MIFFKWDFVVSTGPCKCRRLTCSFSCSLSNSYMQPLFLLTALTFNILQNFPSTLRAPSPTRFAIHLPAGTEWVQWVWTQIMSNLNGTDIPNKPLSVTAIQQGHPIYWENNNEQLTGISGSQLHVYKPEKTPKKLSSTAIALRQQDTLYVTSNYTWYD